jgi:hypothetical protein
MRIAHAALAGASIWMLAPSAVTAPALPNTRLTPGDVAVHNVGDICRPFFSRRHPRRVSTQLKHSVYVRYFGGYRRGYVIDHLVPRELGGADDLLNLWPEPRSESKRKDAIENRAREEVCLTHRPLAEAQRAFVRDWETAARWRLPP